MKNKKEKSKGVKMFWLVVRRTLITLLVILLFLVGSLYALGLTLANGPSESLRDMLVLSAKQASATKWLPGLFLDDETIEQIMANSKKVTVTEIDINDFLPDKETSGGGSGEEKPVDEWENYPDGVRLEFVQGSTYRAYVTLIKDASRVFTGVSDKTWRAAYGLRLFKMVEKYDALVCINGGEFSDIGGKGNGNAPMGVTYSQGECVWEDNITYHTFIGFDKNDRLVVSEGMTREKADELGVRDGVCFQTGNVLITNENGKVQLHYSDGNVGAAQRTAIGQRADGTVIMIVTDGRSASSIGASRNDIIDLLVSYGAVCAGMLDGGTSSMMYYDNYIEQYGIDPNTLDEYQLQGMVNKYKAFIPPRSLPTYFIVSKTSAGE